MADKNCLKDVQDGAGQSLPRDPDDKSVVICVQPALKNLKGDPLPKDAKVPRCIIDDNDQDYECDDLGNVIIPRPKGIVSPGGVPNPETEDGLNYVICPPSTDYPYKCDPSEGVPVVHDPVNDNLVGAPEHDTQCSTGIFAALPASQGLQPLDFLVSAVGADLEEVGTASFTIENPTCRVMVCNLIIGLHIEHRIESEEFNSVFTQARYEISGILDGPKTLLGHQQFTIGDEALNAEGAQGTYDFPSLSPTTCCFRIDCESTATITVAMDQRVRGYDGVSEIAAVRTNWNLFCSTEA